MLLFRVQKIGWKTSANKQKRLQKSQAGESAHGLFDCVHVRRTGQPTGRVTPKPFFKRPPLLFFLRCLPAQRAVLERELAAVGSV